MTAEVSWAAVVPRTVRFIEVQRRGMALRNHPANKKKTGCRGRSKLAETRVSSLGIPDTLPAGVKPVGSENAFHYHLTATAAGYRSFANSNAAYDTTPASRRQRPATPAFPAPVWARWPATRRGWLTRHSPPATARWPRGTAWIANSQARPFGKRLVVGQD